MNDWAEEIERIRKQDVIFDRAIVVVTLAVVVLTVWTLL